MPSKILPYALSALVLFGAGCSNDLTTSAAPAEQPVAHEAYVKSLSGSVGNATLDLSLSSLFGKIRGSFTHTENGKRTSGIVLGDIIEQNRLVFRLYAGRWNDFAAVTGTWQGNALMTSFALEGQPPADTIFVPSKSQGATFDVVTASKKDLRADGSERCTFHFAYPVLHRANADAVIRNDFGLGPTSTPQTLADDFIERCKTDIEDLLSDTTTADYAKSMFYESETLFSVERNRDGIVSFLIDSYDFEGGAHGMPGIYGVNVDLESGKSITLGDLVKRDELKPFLQKVEKQLLSEYDDALFEEPFEDFTDFVADTKPATEEELVAYAGLNNFYLTDTGFVFYWNVYEISPYAAGQLTVEIPYADVQIMLKPSFISTP